MFKKIFILLFVFCFTIVKAQQNTWNIIPLEDQYKIENIGLQNVYYKDVNNHLDKFLGTWVYYQGNENFKITWLCLICCILFNFCILARWI